MTPARPAFSIVVPTRNHARWIGHAIDSILRQQLPGSPAVEILVYDALSSDDTPSILAGYGHRIRVHRRGDNGQADAINEGLHAASGDIVAWLNSDDAYLPGAFNQVASAFAADPGLAFVYGDALEVDATGRILTPNLFTEDCDRDRFFHSHDYICQPTFFARREALALVGPLRPSLRWFLDYEWLTRFFAAGLRGRRLPRFLAANRDHPGTKTNSGGFDRLCEILGVLSRVPGPGPWFPLRRCARIYGLEYIIKSVNASPWGASPASPRWARHTRSTLLASLNRRFLALVAARSQTDIIIRYQRDIEPLGPSLDHLWAAHAPDLPT